MQRNATQRAVCLCSSLPALQYDSLGLPGRLLWRMLQMAITLVHSTMASAAKLSTFSISASSATLCYCVAAGCAVVALGGFAALAMLFLTR